MSVTLPEALSRWHTVDSDLGTLAYFEWDAHLRETAPTIVFIHGITGSIAFWSTPLLPPLLQFHRIALSLPGHFPAVFPPEIRDTDLTAKRLTDTLIAALRTILGDKKPFLFGHSTGGWAAMAIAARAPEQVAGVVSVSGFTHGRWTGILGTGQLLARYAPPLYRWAYRRIARSLDAFDKGMANYVADPAAMRAHPDYAALGDQYAFFANADFGAFARWFRVMPETDTARWLRNTTAPVLLLHGDKDPIVPIGESRLASRLIPNARLVEIAGAGHMPMLERRAEYDRVVSAWATARLAAAP